MLKQALFDRRRFFSMSGSMATLYPGFKGLPRLFPDHLYRDPEESSFQRFVLDLGHRGTRSGPVACLSNGTLLWITTEPEAPYLAKAMWPISRLVMRKSTDGGRSWQDAKILQQGTKQYSLLSHTLFQSKSGLLLHLFVKYSGYDYETGTPEKSLCQVYLQKSKDLGDSWSEPFLMPTGERYHGDILSMTQLLNGRWIYPFCFLTNIRSQFAVSVMFSDDDGRTWQRSETIIKTGGSGFESGASEPTVVELPDGRLWMLIRAQTGFQWESFSSDQGATWTAAVPSLIPSSNAPATALRLLNGDIALAWNNHVQSNYSRQSLVVGLTRDGKSFSGLREIDYTDFSVDPAIPNQHVTYPYLTETKEGKIMVSYNKGNWSRHNLPMLALLDPAWISVKEELVDFHHGRSGWQTINPGPAFASAIENYSQDEGENLALLLKADPRYQGTTGITRNIAMISRGKIIIKVKITHPEAYILFGQSMLTPNNHKEACLRIRFDSEGIYVASGTATHSQENHRSTHYDYTSYPINAEKKYPETFNPDTIFNISLSVDCPQKEVKFQINDRSTLSIPIDQIIGLGYLGFLISPTGQLKIYSIQTFLK